LFNGKFISGRSVGYVDHLAVKIWCGPLCPLKKYHPA
jgi:hypothetical protein